MKELKAFLKLIKIEHTLFAAPFFILAIIVIKVNNPSFLELSFPKLLYMTICFICARALGMAWNRIIDFHIDFKNPRTATRPLQTREISIKKTYLFTFFLTILFIYSASRINPFAFIFSPFLILYMIFYAYTKRFTYLCHFILGSIHAMLPLAVSICLFGKVYGYLFLLSLGVMFLIAASDIIYALQDIRFDIREKLYSIPAKYGLNKSIAISFVLYGVSLTFFIVFFFYLKNFKPT
ncbi:MAG: 4-hydroxybenzoate octaprenyltransferase [Planctomycetota bacterium]